MAEPHWSDDPTLAADMARLFGILTAQRYFIVQAIAAQCMATPSPESTCDDLERAYLARPAVVRSPDPHGFANAVEAHSAEEIERTFAAVRELIAEERAKADADL